MLLDVIPLQAELVKGTPGRLASSPELGPLLIGSDPGLAAENLRMTEVGNLVKRHFA